MLASKGKPLIPPVKVETGPCKEHKILGDDIHLTKLPAPLLNRADGGNYIQTLGVNIVPDKDGTISLTEIAKEGPFGEMHGYSFLDKADGRPQPLYHVKATTYRTGAILLVCVPGRARGVPDETHTMIGTLAAAEMREQLQRAGLPVLQVFTPYETQVIWAVVQVDRVRLRAMKANAGALCTAIGDVVFRQKCGMQVHRVLVVGDDIDPFDFAGGVTWAFATRCRPAEDEFHFQDVTAYPIVPSMSHGPGTKLTGSKVVANCLLPVEYDYTPGNQALATCDFANGCPEEVK